MELTEVEHQAVDWIHLHHDKDEERAMLYRRILEGGQFLSQRCYCYLPESQLTC
jgi:hypothetical protein